MIKKTFKSFQNKNILKYFLAVLFFLMIGCVTYSLKSPKNELNNKRKYTKLEIRKILYNADVLFDSYHLDESYNYYNQAQLLCDIDTDYIDYVYARTCMASVEQKRNTQVYRSRPAFLPRITSTPRCPSCCPAIVTMLRNQAS